MYRKSVYSEEYFEPDLALWPEKWSDSEEGKIIYLDVYHLKPSTIERESINRNEPINDRVVVFKIEGSSIIRIIRLSVFLYFSNKSGVNIFIPIDGTDDATLRKDLFAKIRYNSIEFLG